MVTVNIDVKRITKAAQSAMAQTALIIHRQAIQVISEPGAFPSSDEDIVDTGVLRANQQPPEINGNTAILRNTAIYSEYVASGYTLRNGGKVEGRDWMGEAVKRVKPQAAFEIILKAKLKL